MGKVNPRRLCTGDDVNRAFREGIDLGVKRCLKMVLYILLDKHDAPDDDVQQLAEEVTWLANAIADERISWSFVDTVLKEHQVQVRLR